MRREKQLDRFRQQAVGRSPAEIVRLLRQYGFECAEKKAHTICKHPEHADLRHTIPRHRPVKSYIVRYAVKLIDTLLSREANGGK